MTKLVKLWREDELVKYAYVIKKFVPTKATFIDGGAATATPAETIRAFETIYFQPRTFTTRATIRAKAPT